MKDLLLRLKRDQRGVAAVEFALWSVFIFVVLMAGFDFGIYSIQKAQLAKSVSEASNFAFATRKNVDVSQIRQYVNASTDLPGAQPTVTVTCNVNQTCVNTNRPCACLSATGVLSTATCNSNCSNGAPAGFFVTIEARYTYQQPIMPSGFLDGAVMVEKSTVRLQ